MTWLGKGWELKKEQGQEHGGQRMDDKKIQWKEKNDNWHLFIKKNYFKL